MADTGWCVVVFISFVVFLAEFPTAAWTKSYQCPKDCTCLGGLVDCSRKDLTTIPEDLPPWVEILDLSSNQITDISPLTAQGLTLLKDLDLSNNKIEKTSHTFMADLPSLKELKLNYNRLKEIPLLPLGANITSLSLQHNVIETIDAEALDRLPKLRHLSLGYNQLKELTAAMFRLHPSLHQLYLNNNRIKHVEKGALRNLPSLTWLKLNKNKIKHLPKEVFSDLTKLQDLELSRNRLQVIEGLTFTGMENLVTLKLDRNAISDLMDGAFYGPGNVQNLILDHNNISAITKNWLYGLTRLEVLELSHNRISHIEEEVWTSCELLSKLDLRDNQLSVVTEYAFGNLGSLQHLFLDNNHMSYIAKGAFRHLRSLQVLELNNNEISWTIEDTDGAFDGLSSLKRLGLRNNHIKLIGKWVFKGLDHLTALHLENNSLTSIQTNAFSSMKSLQELQLNTSSLVCDCQLGWLPRWLAQASFQHTVTAKCIHPAELQGIGVMEVDLEQFKCTDSPKPVIQTQPEPQAALKGSNTSVECVAVSSDSSPLVVQWRKDYILLEEATVETHERSTEEGTVEIRSVLVFRDVQDEHGGVYQCVVSNNLGTAYSAKAIITVNVLPYFLNTPEDVTAPLGTTARLECKATGHPSPRIKWKKDGGDSFPAARERRLLMMPTDDVFFITKVNLEDEGVYSCTAENNVGTVVANATLKVLRRPMFEHAMEDKIVQQGSTAVLECMASGNPKPNVEWLKDDEPLQVTDRHFFAAEKRLLVIYQTDELDAGVYTCHVQNSLAKEEGQSRLTVTSVIDKSVRDPETDGGGVDSGGAHTDNGIFGDDSMMTGIIIIAVVCCVVGTSLIWVIIIYKTRKRTEEYSSTPTDETTLPGEMPSTPFHSSERDSSSPGLLGVAQTPGVFGRYAGMEVNGGFGYSPAKVRMAAIFPSDIEDDHLRQSIPLTSDEQQPAESSDTSITMLRRLRHSTGGSDTLQSTPSPQHSAPCLHGSRTNVLQTFQPHLASHTCPHHPSPSPACDSCQRRTTVALVHTPATGGHCGSCPRLDTIVSEDEPEMRSSSDDREATPGHLPDGYHGSLPPGHYSDESDYSSSVEPYSATFPPSHCRRSEQQPSEHTVPRGLSSAGLANHRSSSSLPRPSPSHSDCESTPASHTDRPTELAKTMGSAQLTRPSCQSAAPYPRAPSSSSPSSRVRSHPSTLANGHVCGMPRTENKPVAAPHSSVSCGDECSDSECYLDDDDVEGGYPLSSSVPQVTIIPNCYPRNSAGAAVDAQGALPSTDSVLRLTSRDS